MTKFTRIPKAKRAGRELTRCETENKAAGRQTELRLPTSQADLLKHYTLSDEDLGHIRQRRRPH